MAINPINTYYQKMGRYPGNNKQWWIARAEVDDDDNSIKAGDFLPAILDKLFSGNNHAPRGHYILDAFNKNRSAVSGVVGLTTEVTTERPNTTCFFAGRIWFACNSTVYFSQLLTDRFKAGLCYQEADPTSEDVSDLIATDGGVIPIPEASKIIRILPNAGGILVFALNGVWNITGTNAGFSALDISVNKVSPVGCHSPMSIVETDAGVYWWSDVGILAMSQAMGMYGPVPGQFDRSNISELTIQTYYNSIPDEIKEEAKGLFDAKSNTITWLFRDEDVDEHQYNKVLILDVSLKAFYPWKFSKIDDEDAPVVKGYFISERLNTIGDPDNPTITDISPSSIEYTTMKNESLRFAQVRNIDFKDWETEDGTGVGYNSYVEAGYELFNDAMRKKALTYVFTYLRRTETRFVDEEEFDDPSSCYMTVKWDWASSTFSNKWTTPVQVYRQSRLILQDGPEYDTGFPIVITKNKVRGNGKSIQFRFGTDEPGKNFDLHGWSVAVTGATVP